MSVALSTAACPDLARELPAFDEACRARGLDGIELVLGDREDPDEVTVRARAAGIRVVALRVARIDEESAPALARASARLDAPVSVPADGIAGELTNLADVFAEQRGKLLIAHGSDLDQVVALSLAVGASAGALGLAWEVRPSSDDLRDRGAILLTARDHLALIRLHGGGPEQNDQGGRGLGSLFVELAMSQYTGPMVLHPSSEATLPRWSAWLASRRAGGCGSAHDREAVAVQVEAELGADMDVDVRDVEPKDRLETILGAYRVLRAGATLRLTVDHDPSCMYHMLSATEPEGSFTFRKVDDGPEVWSAEVTRR